jgi:hypothetical protein
MDQGKGEGATGAETSLLDQEVEEQAQGQLEEWHAKIQFYQTAHAVAFLHSW